MLDYHPELVIGCFGLNDAPNGEEYLKTYRAGVSSILSRIQRAGAVPVFMTPNMLNTRVIAEDIPREYRGLAEKTARIQNDGIMDAYMDAAREECTRLGVTVCDAYARWKKLQQAGVDTTTLLSNRINHPDRQMHALFADCLLEGRLYAD